MIDNSLLNIDSRDFLSIYGDLINAIPNLSQVWNTTDENDAGIALVKEMSFLGDMLSYNHDRAVLEVYPSTVTQRKNAVQVFGLLGYKLHWYQSARCTAYITNRSDYQTVTLPKLATFKTQTDNISYTYVGNQLNITTGNATAIDLIQGYPVTPSLKSSNILPEVNKPWHDVYNYNIVVEDIVTDNKIYLNDFAVDETTIILVDNYESGDTWIQVNNIDALPETGKYFELKTDDENRPYIELPKYWKNFAVSQFKLFYIVTLGEAGQIQENTLTTADSRIIAYDMNNEQVDVSGDILVANDNSTIGYNYETASEARDNSVNYINTYDTLITTSDFEKATRRLTGVANCIATDKTNDPDPESLIESGTDLKIYVTRTDAYESQDPEDFEAYIITELNKNKLMLLKIDVDLTSIKYYDWKISGTVFLKEQVSKTEAQNILIAINNKIQQVYSKQNMLYNATIGYSGLIDTIKSASNRIYNVDLDGVEYQYTPRDEHGNITGDPEPATKTEITGKYRTTDFTETQDPETGLYTYTADLSETVPILGGSVIITMNNGQYTIQDNKTGVLLCDSALFTEGTVDYSTGELSFTTTTAVTNILMTYQKNVINMVLPMNIDPNVFSISEENIKL